MSKPKVKKRLIYLGYKKRSGKDTVARMFVEELNKLGLTVETAAFAAKVKRDTCELYGISLGQLEQEKNDVSLWKNVRRRFIKIMSKLVGVPIHVINRESILLSGVFARNINKMHYANIISEAYVYSATDVFIVTDFRFKHEYNHRALTINIKRMVPFKFKSDTTDEELDDFIFDLTIENNSTLDVLRKEVRNIINHHIIER